MAKFEHAKLAVLKIWRRCPFSLTFVPPILACVISQVLIGVCKLCTGGIRVLLS